ncbi:MAG TPA: hypothetical protein VLA15_07100 [Desulfurivibrionaceae bacterium]|nr:hypothetical protein [Desulfurivibrionaceae bacterium]
MKLSAFASQRRPGGALLLLLFLAAVLPACSYSDRVAPVRLPETSSNMVEIEGLKISAQAYTDPKAAQATYGFDARRAGVLPVQVTFQNDSRTQVSVNPDQTFLLDNLQNAWPILSLEKTYERTHKYVKVGETAKGTVTPALLLGAAGAVAGAAIGIVSGNNVGEAMGKGAVIGAAAGAIGGGASAYAKSTQQIKQDLADKNMKNQPIQPGQIAYGTLFFPGTPGEEASSARELRLSLTFGYNDQRVVVINLATP